MEYNIQNTDTIREIRDAARLSISEGFPNKLSDKVIPVINVNPKSLKTCDIVRSVSAINSTSATLYTTPSDKDFFVTSIALSLIKDVTSPSNITAVTATIGGASQNLLSIAGITLTAQTLANNIVFPFPVEIDRGTNITLTNTSATANIKATATIAGFINEF